MKSTAITFLQVKPESCAIKTNRQQVKKISVQLFPQRQVQHSILITCYNWTLLGGEQKQSASKYKNRKNYETAFLKAG